MLEALSCSLLWGYVYIFWFTMMSLSQDNIYEISCLVSKHVLRLFYRVPILTLDEETARNNICNKVNINLIYWLTIQDDIVRAR